MALVSVVMPVYHPNEKYMTLAINSILSQTHKELELIIVEDSPEGCVESLINRISDKRIKYIGNKNRLGIAGSINRGIECSSGKYIARMDDDDFSLKNRIKIQHDYMENNTNIAVCGTWCIKSDDYGVMFHEIISPEKRRVKLLFENEGLFHPTAFFRKSFLINNNIKYDEELLMAEDYGLWEKICQISELHTIHRPLLVYRIHSNQASNNSRQLFFINLIRKRQLRVFKRLTDEDIDEFIDFKCPSPKLIKIIKNIRDENKNNNYYSRLYLEGTIGCKWFVDCKQNLDISFLKVIKDGIIFNPVNKLYLFIYIFIAIIDKFRTFILVKRCLLSKHYSRIVSLIDNYM